MTSKGQTRQAERRADKVRRLRAERTARLRRTVNAASEAGQVTAEQIEAEAQAEARRPMWGGWDTATLQRLRSDARSVSRSSAAPPADDLVSAAIIRAAEHKPAALRALTSADPIRREQGHAYLRGAMRSIASHAVRGALVDVDAFDAREAERERLRLAALAADGPTEQADADGARWRVTSAARFEAAMTAHAGGASMQDAADRVRYGAGMAKIRERTRPERVQLLREQSLEALLWNGSSATVHVLENGGSEAAKRYTSDAGAERLARQAEAGALAASLRAEALPGGAAGTLAAQVAEAAQALERLTRQGWMRRAAGCQREAERLRAQAERSGALALSLVDAEGRADTAGRKRHKAAAAEAARQAEAAEAGALALLGALGAAEALPGLGGLLGAACDVSREGRPLLDVSAVLAALGLPLGDAPAKALRKALRGACGAPGLGASETGRTRAEALAEAAGTLPEGRPAARWEALALAQRAERAQAAEAAQRAEAADAERGAWLGRLVCSLAEAEAQRLRTAREQADAWRSGRRWAPVAPAIPVGRVPAAGYVSA